MFKFFLEIRVKLVFLVQGFKWLLCIPFLNFLFPTLILKMLLCPRFTYSSPHPPFFFFFFLFSDLRGMDKMEYIQSV